MISEAKREYNRQWRAAHPDYHNEWKRRRYAESAEYRAAAIAQGKTWKQNNPSRNRALARGQTLRLRIAALVAWGGKCVQCGISDTRVLQFDHVDGNGRADTRSHNVLLRHLKDNPTDSAFQLLCANCHAIKTCLSDNHRPWIDAVAA